MSTKRTLASLISFTAFALCLPVAGCVGAADPTPGDEAVDEAQSAFGEATCNTDVASPDVTLTSSWPAPIYAWRHSGLGYDHPLCTSAFEVLHQNPPIAGCTVRAKWDHDASVAMPTTQVNCENSCVEVRNFDSAGNQLGSSKVCGTWTGSACALPGYGNSTVASVPAAGTKLAIAQAYVGGCAYDRILHKYVCLQFQDGVQTQTSCP